uniref:Uncharacterized protein n=1 Tax=Pseudo-nitzschia australis TaxID=44445 RepID=A0A6V0CP67_9STRA
MVIRELLTHPCCRRWRRRPQKTPLDASASATKDPKTASKPTLDKALNTVVVKNKGSRTVLRRTEENNSKGLYRSTSMQYYLTGGYCAAAHQEQTRTSPAPPAFLLLHCCRWRRRP